MDNGQEQTLGPGPGMFLEMKSFFYQLAVSRHLFPQSVKVLVPCSNDDFHLFPFLTMPNAFVCRASEL